ncbi:MAG: hypothetical protein J0H40_19380 [Rhizobiales bacterium]|nr:hypothetical protein [Hyphomicrobiales bacterium]
MASRRCADWRFPTEKQARAEETARRLRANAPPTRTDEECWWDSVLSDPRAATPRPSPARSLKDIKSELLRVECLRCMRIVEIQRLDAVRLYGGEVTWKAVGQKLLDDGCQHRTGRHEEDGCWPDFRS